MLKHRRENRLIHVLVCWSCDGRAGPAHYNLEHGGATCGLCGDRNPLGNLHRMPLDAMRSPHQILVSFIPRDGVSCHALHVNAKTVLGPWIRVSGDETMVRMLRYLGASDEQIREYQEVRMRWGQGTTALTLRNLLRIDWSKL